MRKNEVRLEDVIPFFLERLAAGESVKFTPQGTSMIPMILGGRDQVILSPKPEKWKKYDLPFYQRDNGQYVLHRIIRVGDTLTCIGDNQFIYEEGLRPDQMIAIATGFVHRGKTYSTTQLSYKIYCRFWHLTRGIRRFLLRVICKIKGTKMSVR